MYTVTQHWCVNDRGIYSYSLTESLGKHDEHVTFEKKPRWLGGFGRTSGDWGGDRDVHLKWDRKHLFDLHCWFTVVIGVNSNGTPYYRKVRGIDDYGWAHFF